MTVLRAAALSNSPPDTFGVGGDLKLPIIGCSVVPAIAVSTSNSPSTGVDASFPVANLLNASTHLRWASDNTSDDVYLDATGFPDDVNYVGFAAHNFLGFTITIYGLTSGSPANLFQIFEPTLIGDNDPLLFQFPQAAYTQIRVKISGSGVRTAAIMYCGLLLTMPRGVKVDVEHSPFSQALKNDVLSGYSESGNFLGRLVRNQIFENKYEFTNVANDFFTSTDGTPLWAFLRLIAPTQPFFIAWAPQDYPEEFGFGWLMTDPSPTKNPVTRRWSFTLQVRGYAAGILF